ncbi:MAG: glycosyltransferase family 9 protein, partial [Chloroflexi bacterium]|nr:glycosyltransferase family 9 protein [Chloroflexota bacterium]
MRDTLIGWITRLLSALFPTVRRPEPAEGPLAPASILILKPCCLGDVLLATPAVAALKRAFPDAQIDFAVGSWARAAVANSPHLRQLVDTGKVGQGAYGWRDLWSLAARLRAGHYDLCVTLDRSPRIGLVPWLAGIPLRAGLDSRGRGFAHNIRVPVPPIRYEPELYLDVPRAVIPQTARSKFDFVPSEFFPTDADKAFAQALLQAALPDPRWPIVAIHPGGGNNPGMVLASKRWPAERFAAIANRLSETYKATVVLIGADSDREATQAVRAAMPFDRLTATPLDLTARLNFGQLGALYQRCALMIGNDSGVL